MSQECDCGYSGDFWMCINGVVYGPCDHPDCGGVCIAKRDCDHECHAAPPGGAVSPQRKRDGMKDRKTIYVVEEGEYSDYRVLCAYENEDDARIAVEHGVGDSYREMALLPSGDIPKKVTVYHAGAGNRPGSEPQADEPHDWDEWDFDAPKDFTEWPVRAPGFVGVRFSGTDKERVRKAAQDRAARLRAEQEGIA